MYGEKIKNCARCGRKTNYAFNHFYVNINYDSGSFLTSFGTNKKYVLCKECSKLAKETIDKFVDELTAFENPLSNGPYIIGQDFNTKDWWIFDDTKNKKLAERFNTYDEAYYYTCKLIEDENNPFKPKKKEGDQNGSK